MPAMHHDVQGGSIDVPIDFRVFFSNVADVEAVALPQPLVNGLGFDAFNVERD